MRRHRSDRFEKRVGPKDHIYQRVENAIFQSSCGKIGYRSKKEALTIKNSRLRGGSHNRPEMLRAYPCHICGCWHLTKQGWRDGEEEEAPHQGSD